LKLEILDSVRDGIIHNTYPKQNSVPVYVNSKH